MGMASGTLIREARLADKPPPEQFTVAMLPISIYDSVPLDNIPEKHHHGNPHQKYKFPSQKLNLNRGRKFITGSLLLDQNCLPAAIRRMMFNRVSRETSLLWMRSWTRYQNDP
jgi:hypothetical protein